MHPSAWNSGTQGYPNDKCKLTKPEDMRLQDCKYKTLIRKHYYKKTDYTEHTFQLVTLWNTQNQCMRLHEYLQSISKYLFYGLDKTENKKGEGGDICTFP